MSTFTTKKRRKKSAHKHETYLRWYDEVKGIHKFSFARRPKNEFTPQQKAAITRLRRKHRYVLQQMQNDRGVFKKASKGQIRVLKRSGIQNEGFTVTNRGVIVPGVRASKVERKRQRVTIRGKGKQTRIDIKLPAKRELFIPYNTWPDESFPNFCRRIIKKYKPDWVMIQNEVGQGRARYSPRQFLKYIDRDIVPRIEDFQRRYGIDKNPFVGLWLLWGKFI